IQLTSPADGATYILGRSVTASFTCADEAGDSGLASCQGSVDDGAAIDTATVSEKSFAVNASDTAGNTTSIEVAYHVLYDFGAGSGGGFAAPLANPPTLNALNAGRAIPLKFGLGGNQWLAILADGSPTSVQIACDTTAAVDADVPTTTAGQSGLTYDPTSGLYTYVWKTDSAWAGSCRRLHLRLAPAPNPLAL